jgi:transposase-like protein
VPGVLAPKGSEGEQSEPERTVGASTPAAKNPALSLLPPPAAHPEVVAKATRRRFTVDYKLKILEQAEACSQPSQLGALLRREGLYHSNLALWRQQRQEGILQALTPKTRGRKANPKSQLIQENEQLRRQNQQLNRRLQQAEIIIEFQKKLSEALGIPLKGENNG